jgi:hypothetical protein
MLFLLNVIKAMYGAILPLKVSEMYTIVARFGERSLVPLLGFIDLKTKSGSMEGKNVRKHVLPKSVL